MSSGNIWTKELVQKHAQTAVTIELYTLPFYVTAYGSIKDTSDPSAQGILSVAIEEMFHLQTAANLCSALDTKPNFTIPTYDGTPIPYLKPDDPETGHYALVNAVLSAFDEKTLQTMLDIETPEEFQDQEREHTTPDYPYASIGEFYNALLTGIDQVGEDQFGWTTSLQRTQQKWGGSNLQETISNLEEARTAITTVVEQGEGKAMNPVPTPPFTGEDFPIPAEYQLISDPMDPSPYYKYSHYGRFADIQNSVDQNGFPSVYSGTSKPSDTTVITLIADFASFIDQLNRAWADAANPMPNMVTITTDVLACWQAGAIPQWS